MLDRQNVMLKFGLDSHGQHLPNLSQYLCHRRSKSTSRSVYLMRYLSQYCCTAARLGYSQKHLSRNFTSIREHAIISCWVFNSPETTSQTKISTNLQAEDHFVRRSASAKLSSQVTVSECGQTKPSINLSLMNQRSDLFDQEHPW